MRIRLLLSLLLSLPTALHAQLGVYGLFEGTRLTAQGSSGSQSTATGLYGPAVGIYYTPVHFGPLAAGLDLRGNYLSGGNQHLRNALVGLRVAAKAPILPLRPYAQASVGVGGTRSDSVNSSLATHFTNKFEYGVLGGLDVTVLPLIDLRVVEIGYGHLTGISSGTPVAATNLLNLSAGVVVRFP